jgi:hypothetical protein
MFSQTSEQAPCRGPVISARTSREQRPVTVTATRPTTAEMLGRRYDI